MKANQNVFIAFSKDWQKHGRDSMDTKLNERNELLKVIFQGTSSKQGASPMTIKEKASGKGMCPKGF
jgi:hypothetical protein